MDVYGNSGIVGTWVNLVRDVDGASQIFAIHYTGEDQYMICLLYTSIRICSSSIYNVGSYLISFILHYISAKQIEKDLFDIKLFIKPILLIAIGVVCFYVFEKMWYIRWGGAILFFVYVFIKEKEIIVEILNKRK